MPSGKSRAFVNDTPVKLDALHALSGFLVDIHSQNQSLDLTNNEFQFKVIDSFAGNETVLDDYISHLKQYKVLQNELSKLQTFQAEAIKEQDYNLFLLNEMEEANLVDGELESLEEEYETLNNVEDIKEKLIISNQLLSEGEVGIISTLTELKNYLQKLSGFSTKYDELFNRVNSSLIELDDVYAEVENYQEQLEADPKRLEVVNSKLQIIHNLFQKHNTDAISELFKIKDQLNQKVSITENLDSDISKVEEEIKEFEIKLNESAKTLHINRENAIPKLIEHLQKILSKLCLLIHI